MNSTKRAARVAGALYLISGVFGFFDLMYVPSKLIVSGNAAATANNILASETLFRAGMVSELIGGAEWIFVVWALYRLLSSVNKTLATLMVILGLASVPIMMLNVSNEFASLALLHGTNSLSVFGKAQLDALSMLFVHLHGEGFTIAEVFWGLWLIPFGVLVMRSGFLPRILGALLIVACFGYLADSFTSVVLPSYDDLVNRFAGILEAGELPIIFWLLIIGAKDQPLADSA